MTMFVRVRSKTTGHEFDVPDTHPALGEALVPVKSDRFPPAARPRQPKHRVRRKRDGPERGDPQELPAPDGSGESPSRPAGQKSELRKEVDHD